MSSFSKIKGLNKTTLKTLQLRQVKLISSKEASGFTVVSLQKFSEGSNFKERLDPGRELFS
jgi:hypothetical protein